MDLYAIEATGNKDLELFTDHIRSTWKVYVFTGFCARGKRKGSMSPIHHFRQGDHTPFPGRNRQKGLV